MLGAWTLKYLKLQVMIRFLFCFFLSCVSLMPLHAQEKVKALCFFHVDGRVFISLKHELTFDLEVPGEVSISADNLDPIKLKISDMHYVECVEVDEKKTAEIGKILSTKDIFIEALDNGYAFSGMLPNEKVEVVSMGGLIVYSQKADAEGKVQLITSNLPAGVYIIKANNRKTIKIQKR